jgi:hypothetical protein
MVHPRQHVRQLEGTASAGESMFSMDPQEGTSCGTTENILNPTLQGLGFALC